jgi:PelA/Pel-15E family pectate lyase
MVKFRFLVSFIILSVIGINAQAAKVLDASWSDVVRGRCSDQTAGWWSSAEAIRIAENVMLYQKNIGGWPKNINMQLVLTQAQKNTLIAAKPGNADCTIDNSACYYELMYLSNLYKAITDSTMKAKVETSFLNGIQYLLKMQYANGGWPQFYPLKGGYSNHITYNDDAMVRTMTTLKHIYLRDSEYSIKANDDIVNSAKAAFNKGVECIVKTQYNQNNRLTVWCAQHHYSTLIPVMARSYELASLSGAESSGIINLLMGLENPSKVVRRAIHSAVAWYDESRIKGQRLESFTNSDGLADKRIVYDSKAADMWGRFYTLTTNTPFFCDRDGIVKYSIAEIGHERRNGYSWYGTWGNSVISTYNTWKTKNGQTIIAYPLPNAEYNKPDSIKVRAYAKASSTFLNFDLIVDGTVVGSFKSLKMDTALTNLSAGQHTIVVKSVYQNDYTESDTTLFSLPLGMGSKPKLASSTSICSMNSKSKTLTINLSEFGDAKLEIFDIHGRRYYAEAQEQGSRNLPLNFLSNGIYIVRLTNKNNLVNTSKIVVQ